MAGCEIDPTGSIISEIYHQRDVRSVLWRQALHIDADPDLKKWTHAKYATKEAPLERLAEN